MKKFLLSLAAVAMSATAAFAGTVTFDFTVPSSLGSDFSDIPTKVPSDASDSEKSIVITQNVIVRDGVTLSFSAPETATATNSPRLFYGSGNSEGWTLRFYKDNSFIISTNGESISKIDFEGTNIGKDWTVSTGKIENNAWSATEAVSSVIFGKSATGNNPAIKSITVYFGSDVEIPDTPEAPKGTITVSEALKLITDGYEGAATVKGYVTSITEISTQYGNATYAIADAAGGTPTLQIYRGLYLNGENFTSEDQLKVGDQVEVQGDLVNYKGNTPQFNTGSKLLSINGTTTGGGNTGGGNTGGDEPGNDGNVLNVNDAKNIDGTFNEEKLKDDGSVQTAANYQPLKSFELGGYTFSFTSTNENASSQPAYYYATSTNATQQATVRVYNGTTMTITGAAGTHITKIAFTGSNLGKDAAFTCSNGTFEFNGNNATWTGSSDYVNITANASWRISAVEITSENGSGDNTGNQPGTGGDNPGGNEPDQPEKPTGTSVTFDFTQPSTLGLGLSDAGQEQDEVVLTGLSISNEKVKMTFSAPEDASSQPRLYYGSGNSAGWTLRFYKDSEFIVAADQGYRISAIEFNGTNIGKDWSMSTGAIDGTTWSVSEPVPSVTFSKTATGNNPAIKSMTVYYTLSTGVETAVVEEGEAIYFNLQGARVMNPERGIYVKVQNGKAVKVVK